MAGLRQMQLHRLTVLLVLASAVGAAPLPYSSPFYQLQNVKHSLVLNWKLNLTYTQSAQWCDKQVAVPFHDDVNVRSHQCYTKCRVGAAGNPSGTVNTASPYFCGGFSSDTSGSNALCVDQDTCEKLCNSLDECWGYNKQTTQNRCYLLTSGCSTGTSANSQYGLYAKTAAEVPTCALGLGVDVESTKYPDADGLYQWETDSLYHQINGKHSVAWDSTGNCGWKVLRDNSTAPAPAPPPAVCQDDVPTANHAFVQHGSEYQDDVCSMASAWGSGTYCTNIIFAGLCPATCPGVSASDCTGDNLAAAEQVGIMRGDTTTPYCKVAECSDPLIKSLCKTTCASSRRLEAEEVKAVAASIGDSLRLQLAQDARAAPRRMAGAGSGPYEEVYATYDPKSCSAFSGVQVQELTKMSLYDVEGFSKSVSGMQSVWQCPDKTTYSTTGGKYCQHNNILAKYNTEPEVVYNQCKYKCGSDTTTRSKFCDGNGESFPQDSNALCLPRESCEALCTKLSDCHSIDMHRTLPRCYLNNMQCNVADSASPYVTDTAWDVVVKNTRADRLTFSTYSRTKCLNPEVSSTASITRAACETLCAAKTWCHGFNFVHAYSATAGTCGLVNKQECGDWNMIYPAIFNTSYPLVDFIVKGVPAPCQVGVQGDAQVAGLHTGTTTASATEYVSADNRTRVVWSKGVTNECNTWSYEMNTLPSEVLADLKLCVDAPFAANIYLFGTDENKHQRFPCMWGKEVGYCTDKAFNGLCAASCSPFLNATIGGNVYEYHNTTLGHDSSCLGDNNEGITVARANGNVSFGLVLPYVANGMTACQDMWNFTGMYNQTHSPCHYGTHASIVQALCRATCGPLAAPGPKPTAIPPDESNFPVGQSARLLTTSSMTDGNTLQVSYLPWEGATWKSVYRGHSGSSGGSSSGCEKLSGDPLRESWLTTTSLFRREHEKAAGSSMGQVCRNASLCPEFTTCVFSKGLFTDEMRLWRGSLASPAQLIAQVNEVDRAALLGSSRFHPKTLVSAERVEAIIATDKMSSNDLFRNVPGTPRTRIQYAGEPGSKLIVTQVSPNADGGSTAKIQLGRTYSGSVANGPSMYFQPWKTDVLRVERFNDRGIEANKGKFQFDMYAPAVEKLVVFRFDAVVDGGDQLDDSAVEKLDDGWFRVTVASVGADFVGTEDKFECKSTVSPCDPNARCQENLGAPPTCTCMEPYVTSGSACIMRSEDFNIKSVPLHYFRLYHTVRLDYGWRLTEVALFGDDDCTQAFTQTAYAGHGSGTSVESSPAYPDYDGVSYAKEGAFDGSTTSEWWSECLNCNPEVMDGTHGAAAYMHFTFKEQDIQERPPLGEQVRCIKITQNTNHMATGMVLERGPATGVDCGGSGEDRCPATQKWVVEEAGETVTIKPWCGLQDTQIFGQLLVNKKDGAQTGSFPDVPSSCHCQQLCIDHIDQGCRSYKYYAPMRHCLLQAHTFSRGKGSWGTPRKTGFPGWISGDFQIEGATRISGFRTVPEKVKPGEPFAVTIYGVGLPHSPEKSLDPSPRQRMKIVEVGQSCVEEPPITVEGIGCVRTETQVKTAAGHRDEVWYTICSPRPTTASDENVTFTGLALQWAAVNKQYKVCYCGGDNGCYKPSDYVAIEGLESPNIDVGSSVMEWSSEPAEIYRKNVLLGNNFTITVKRPAFGSYTSVGDWKLKIVRAHFGCEVDGDDTRFTIAASPIVKNVDEGVWNVTTIPDNLSAWEAGEYFVCVAGSGTADYVAIPSESSRFLIIKRLEADTTQSRGMYGGQRFSARSGSKTEAITTRIKVKGGRLVIPSESIMMLNNNAAAKCGSDAMSFAGKEFTVYPNNETRQGQFFPFNAYSSDEEVAYDLKLWDVPTGRYEVCVCDASLDVANGGIASVGSPQFNMPTGALTYNTTYRLYDDRQCSGSVMETTSLTTTWQNHQCKSKCEHGCTGLACYCGSYDQATTLETALCLSPTMCREACDGHSSCTGVDVHEGKNLCYLNNVTYATASCPIEEEFIHLDKHEGLACTNASDYTSSVGWLHVTSRVHLGNSYVLHPGKVGSIEVTAPEGVNLTYDGFGTSRDRIMLIDGKGTCGVSQPTTAGVFPEEPKDIKTWNLFWPMGYLIDRPHNDTENPTSIPSPAPPPAAQAYGRKEGFYCPGHNFDLSMPVRDELKRHQCYGKCSLNSPCAGADCFCSGHYNGYDGPESNALCLDEAACRTQCSLMNDCSSFDMHKTLPRCFLNTFGCDSQAHDNMLGRDPSYTLVQKLRDATDSGATQGGSGPSTPLRRLNQQRQLLATVDKGYSWDRMLRFTPVKFDVGGSFKVCFCDSTLLDAGNVCSTVSDYMIEVGSAHSSGVSCLLADPDQRFTKGTCVTQFYGGMRCYREWMTPPVLPLPAEAGLTLSSMAFSSTEQLNTWCLYGPEEDTRADARCEQSPVDA